MFLRKKISQRRQQVRENMGAERLSALATFFSSRILVSILLLCCFAAAATAILCMEGRWPSPDGQETISPLRPYTVAFSMAAIVAMVCMGAALYTQHYQKDIISSLGQSLSIQALLLVLLGVAELIGYLSHQDKASPYMETGIAVGCAIILTIVYNQRFAMGISLFFAVLVCFAAGQKASLELYLTMTAGIVACCFSLKEIRTRMKLLEVATMACLSVLVIALATGFVCMDPRILGNPDSVAYAQARADVWTNAFTAAGITIAVGVLLQGLLPVIERVFRVATSMTLLDYSDANQPLLKRLAMEAPGTFSHSLMIGSLAEAAAESIKANGLLARVGAYYHDIGKINKPVYFIENQLGLASRHEQLSPMISQLVIVGHVKDGIEMAKEYRLPRVLWQFIETHHGTTLVEYFYNKAQKREEETGPVSESEFRYAGPTPQTKEAAIVMLCDSVEGAVRSLGEVTPMKIEAVVHNMAMKRLQDGQFDRCDMTFRELSTIEESLSKSLTAQYHGRIAYPKSPDAPMDRPGADRPAAASSDPDEYELDD
jgi:putative nucleotidyltransferase with HDIG domain